MKTIIRNAAGVGCTYMPFCIFASMQGEYNALSIRYQLDSQISGC